MKNKALLYFLAALAFILLLVIGYFVYLTLTDIKTDSSDNSNEQEETTDEEENDDEDTEEEETEEEETVLLEGWTQQESTKFGYKIGVPKNWYYRFFASTQMIGLDPNPIPEASEYAGVFTFTVDDRDFDEMVSEIQDSLDEPRTQVSTLIATGVQWTEVQGYISMDDMFHPGERVLYTMTEVEIDGGTRSYRLTFSEPENAEYFEMLRFILESISFTSSVTP